MVVGRDVDIEEQELEFLVSRLESNKLWAFEGVQDLVMMWMVAYSKWHLNLI